MERFLEEMIALHKNNSYWLHNPNLNGNIIMSEELKQLEIQLAKVRLAIETLELQEAQTRAKYKRIVSSGTETAVNVAKNSVDMISQNVPRTKIRWSSIFICVFLGFLGVLSILAGQNNVIPIEKNSPAAWIIFIAILVFLGLAALLFIIKISQSLFRPALGNWSVYNFKIDSILIEVMSNEGRGRAESAGKSQKRVESESPLHSNENGIGVMAGCNFVAAPVTKEFTTFKQLGSE